MARREMFCHHRSIVLHVPINVYRWGRGAFFILYFSFPSACSRQRRLLNLTLPFISVLYLPLRQVWRVAANSEQVGSNGGGTARKCIGEPNVAFFVDVDRFGASLFLAAPSGAFCLVLLMFSLHLSWSRSFVGGCGHCLAIFSLLLRRLWSKICRYCLLALAFAQVTGLGPALVVRVSPARLFSQPFWFFSLTVHRVWRFCSCCCYYSECGALSGSAYKSVSVFWVCGYCFFLRIRGPWFRGLPIFVCCFCCRCCCVVCLPKIAFTPLMSSSCLLIRLWGFLVSCCFCSLLASSAWWWLLLIVELLLAVSVVAVFTAARCCCLSFICSFSTLLSIRSHYPIRVSWTVMFL